MFIAFVLSHALRRRPMAFCENRFFWRRCPDYVLFTFSVVVLLVAVPVSGPPE